MVKEMEIKADLHADFNKKSIYIKLNEDTDNKRMTELVDTVLKDMCQTLGVKAEEIDSVIDYRFNRLLR